MDKKGVIIQGSARSEGNTGKIVSVFMAQTNFDKIDLRRQKIGQFEYDYKNKTDDFLPLISGVIKKYDTIIFATPVYWYSMSGIMKTFFDRITDLLHLEKDLGRKLRGKNMGLISCGSESLLQEGFTMPFYETANYLEMNYLGDVHTWMENDSIPENVLENLKRFAEKVG